MKRNYFGLSIALMLGAGLSCDRATAPPTTGGMNIVLLSPSNAGLVIAPRATDEGPVDLSGGLGGNGANLLLDGVRVSVTGPTNKTVSVNTASGGFFQVTVDGLLPGDYTVVVEGLAGGKVAHYGVTNGVGVTAGN